MPRDIRTLVFSLSEIEFVLRKFGHYKNVKLPKGNIIQIKNAGDGTSSSFIEFVINDPDGGWKEVLSVQRHDLAFILVQYCVDTGIALPSRGRKSLLVNMTSASLQVVLEEEEVANLARRRKQKVCDPA